MKKNILILGLIISLVFSISFNLSYKPKNFDRERQYITDFQRYYLSVETLLDSLDIGVDHPILETDEGADYLYYKHKVDEYGKF